MLRWASSTVVQYLADVTPQNLFFGHVPKLEKFFICEQIAIFPVNNHEHLFQTFHDPLVILQSVLRRLAFVFAGSQGRFKIVIVPLVHQSFVSVIHIGMLAEIQAAPHVHLASENRFDSRKQICQDVLLANVT
jgi:hypothetical protein